MVNPVAEAFGILRLEFLALFTIVILKKVPITVFGYAVGSEIEKHDIRLRWFRIPGSFSWPCFRTRDRTVATRRMIWAVSPERYSAMTAHRKTHNLYSFRLRPSCTKSSTTKNPRAAHKKRD